MSESASPKQHAPEDFWEMGPATVPTPSDIYEKYLMEDWPDDVDGRTDRILAFMSERPVVYAAHLLDERADGLRRGRSKQAEILATIYNIPTEQSGSESGTNSLETWGWTRAGMLVDYEDYGKESTLRTMTVRYPSRTLRKAVDGRPFNNFVFTIDYSDEAMQQGRSVVCRGVNMRDPEDLIEKRLLPHDFLWLVREGMFSTRPKDRYPFGGYRDVLRSLLALSIVAPDESVIR